MLGISTKHRVPTGCGSSHWTRRELLRIGAVGLLGLPHLAYSAPSRVGSCVFIFLFGGPSHIDLWDLKPQAPAEIRGEFRRIATSVPGIHICEHMPLLAQHMHHVCLIRSMTHPMPVHGPACSQMYTGRPYPLAPTTDQARPEDWPSLGALVTRFGRSVPGIPPAVTVPWYTQFMGQEKRIAGQTGGRMGEAFNPLLLQADLRSGRWHTAGLELPDHLAPSRLQERRRLLQRVEDLANRLLGPGRTVQFYTQYQTLSFQLLADGRLAQALDLDREPPAVRDRYGDTIFGKSLLVARRLVEAGVRLVTVNWYDESFYDKVSPHWDLHYHIFRLLRERMLPVFDRSVSAFIGDLHARGLLAETLVVVTGEFGRSPKIGAITQNNMTEKTGRDHWPHAFTVLVAGGGIPGGQVYGRTDRYAAYVQDDPVTPADLAATVLAHLGIDRHRRYFDSFQQQWQELSEGKPLSL